MTPAQLALAILILHMSVGKNGENLPLADEELAQECMTFTGKVFATFPEKQFSKEQMLAVIEALKPLLKEEQT